MTQQRAKVLALASAERTPVHSTHASVVTLTAVLRTPTSTSARHRLIDCPRASSVCPASLHRHAFREMPRVIHVAAAKDSDVIRQELEGRRDEQGLNPLKTWWDGDHEIRLGIDLVVFRRGHRQHDAVP